MANGGKVNKALLAATRIASRKRRYADGGDIPSDLPQPEMRSYEPTWRDSIARFLMGDSPASSMRGRMVREAIGTTGLGNPQISGMDFVPVLGGALSSQEKAQEGNTGEAIGYGIGAAAPLSPFISRGIAMAPKAVAGGLGILGGILGSTDAAESQRMTRAQQRQLASDAARMKMETEQLRQRGLNEAATKQAVLESQNRIEMERAATERAAKIAEERRLAEAPFRERYPALSNYISGAGIAAASLLPYGSRFAKALQNNAAARAWQNTADKAEKALLKGNAKEARIYVNQLAAFNKAASAPKQNGLKEAITGPTATWTAGALSPLEVSMLPEQIDFISGSPEAKNRALDQLLDWHRFPAALLQGATFATMGSKIPVPVRQSPKAQSEGMVRSFRPRAAATPRRASDENVTPIRAAYAAGGATPFYVRSQARHLEHAGMVTSPIAGRSDKIPMSVKSSSYVIPADIVSGIGQGNSLAGANALNRLLKMGPYGSAATSPKTMAPRLPHMKGFAESGDVGNPTDVIVSGGEFLIPPEKVAEIGDGDINHGHNVLDAMVKHIRQRTIKTLKKLPGPKK